VTGVQTCALPIWKQTDGGPAKKGRFRAYTQAHLDALQEALASGTLTVTYEGRSMTYRSVQDPQLAITVVQNALNQHFGTRVPQYRLSESERF